MALLPAPVLAHETSLAVLPEQAVLLAPVQAPQKPALLPGEAMQPDFDQAPPGVAPLAPDLARSLQGCMAALVLCSSAGCWKQWAERQPPPGHALLQRCSLAQHAYSRPPDGLPQAVHPLWRAPTEYK